MNINKVWFWSLAVASKGNPVIAVITVMLFHVMINLLMAAVEILIYGERFEHWGDIAVGLCFIVASAYTVWMCALYQTNKDNPEL